MSDPSADEVEQMDFDELREEYANLREKSMSSTMEDSEWDRVNDLWNELKARSDVEQPKCPRCGARDWGFSDHTECNECGAGTEYHEDDLRQEIQAAWNRIMNGGVEA